MSIVERARRSTRYLVAGLTNGRSLGELSVRTVPLICVLLICMPLCAASAADEESGNFAATAGSRLQPFLETGLFAGGQTNALIWAQDNARADANLLYVETGLDIELKHMSDRRGHRIGLTASVDMGSESGSRPALGFGLRTSYCISKDWALQAQVGLLGSRKGEEESSNSLGSQRYYFKGGVQARIGLLHRNRVSVVALWRELEYDAELYPIENSWPPVSGSGKAHLFCLGVMLHGKIGIYASLGSFLCMAILTALGSVAEMS